MNHMPENMKHVFDWASIATTVAAIAGWLPPLAALMSIVWLGMQMVDRHRRIRKEEEAARAFLAD